MTTGLLLALVLALAILLVYFGRGYAAWTVPGAIALIAFGATRPELSVSFLVAAGTFAALAVLLGIRPLRRTIVTAPLMPLVARLLPRMGDTERIALDAGTVWWDGQLFSGLPDWRRLVEFTPRPLSARERDFLAGPVDELCAMVSEWQVSQARDLPREAWEFIKRNRFFGMIIPEDYGGLGFSAAAHSAVVTKLASRSITAAVTVMVPNSLGPAELLLHYGTEEQKRYYLPRLAAGDEIPCFALTGPEAGSDAAATESEGVVCRGRFAGDDVVGMRLNWRKRYITLGPVATVIGLAFRLRDPERILGGAEDLGITCALVPAHLPGIDIGQRHDPMGIPFQNGPNTGQDVFVPLDHIIGGRAMAGQGWRMLMECLAAGRAISLPAVAVGGAELATRAVSAYATVREQFDTPIGRFEGIEEPLARIAGLTYLMNAARTLTVGAVDAGERPAVLGAIVKAYLTEAMRRIVNDAMDIRAGAAICRGPRNILATAYMAVPIGITVEGANILTRSMIIYGQGAIRCHPFVGEEMRAVAERDVARLDRALFGHVGFVFRNAARALVLGLTGGRLARAPVSGPTRPLLQALTRMSAAFALVSDAAMATLGGQLKRREKLSGRLADALAWMYLGSASVKRFWAEGAPPRHVPFVRWAGARALWEIQTALQGLLDNLPNRPVAWLLRVLVFPLGARRRPPNDAIGAEVARAVLEDRDERRELTADMYVPPPGEDGLGRLEVALEEAVDALAVETKMRDAVRAGLLDRAPGDLLPERAHEAGVISAADRARLHAADAARAAAIEVDAFEREEFLGLRG
jgi:acyl-CoA dehydrogenase